MFSLSLLLNIGRILALLSDCEKSTWAKDLFIKFESIVAKVMTFVLSMLFGMLSHPTLLLFLIFLNDFRYLVNRFLIKIVDSEIPNLTLR